VLGIFFLEPFKPRRDPTSQTVFAVSSARNRWADITAKGVSATTPEMRRHQLRVKANFRGRTRQKTARDCDRCVDGDQRDRHRNNRTNQLAATPRGRGPSTGSVHRQMSLDVSTTTIASSTPTSPPKAQRRAASAGSRETENLHQEEKAPMSETGMARPARRTDRKVPRKRKNHNTTMPQRFQKACVSLH